MSTSQASGSLRPTSVDRAATGLPEATPLLLFWLLTGCGSQADSPSQQSPSQQSQSQNSPNDQNTAAEVSPESPFDRPPRNVDHAHPIVGHVTFDRPLPADGDPHVYIATLRVPTGKPYSKRRRLHASPPDADFRVPVQPDGTFSAPRPFNGTTYTFHIEGDYAYSYKQTFDAAETEEQPIELRATVGGCLTLQLVPAPETRKIELLRRYAPLEESDFPKLGLGVDAEEEMRRWMLTFSEHDRIFSETKGTMVESRTLDVDASGRAHASALPPAKYEIDLGVPNLAPVTFHVQAGVHLSFEIPIAPTQVSERAVTEIGTTPDPRGRISGTLDDAVVANLPESAFVVAVRAEDGVDGPPCSTDHDSRVKSVDLPKLPDGDYFVVCREQDAGSGEERTIDWIAQERVSVRGGTSSARVVLRKKR